jgi:hypothetical protein
MKNEGPSEWKMKDNTEQKMTKENELTKVAKWRTKWMNNQRNDKWVNQRLIKKLRGENWKLR